MSNKFKLGPIQKKWIRSLLRNPDRQLKYKLGEMNGRKRKCCCLGELCIIAGYAHWKNGRLIDGSSAYPKESWRKLGLRSSKGSASNRRVDKQLAELNDKGTWKEVAKAVLKDPSRYFTKSY